MADITVSLPNKVKEMIEAQVGKGGFASTGDYISDLVRRDHDRRLEELRQIVAEGLASGVSDKTIDDLFAEAQQRLRQSASKRG